MYAALDEEMTRKYQQTYIEKCKKIKAIEMANNECRNLQNEIHCLLDLLAHLTPVEQILGSPYWSDSEESDDLFLPSSKKRNLFTDDQEDSEADDDSDAEELARLEAEYEELVKARDRAKNFGAGSPVKTGGHFITIPKPRRIFKHLPVNEAGEVEFPVTLGRGPNRVTISRIGPVMETQKAGDDPLYLPLDYECRRKYADFNQSAEAFNSDARKQIYYSCSITGNDNGGTVYKILASEGDLQVESDSLAHTWTDFKAKLPAFMATALDTEFPEPRAFFGLEHDNLIKYFKDAVVKQ